MAAISAGVRLMHPPLGGAMRVLDLRKWFAKRKLELPVFAHAPLKQTVILRRLDILLLRVWTSYIHVTIGLGIRFDRPRCFPNHSLLCAKVQTR